MRFWCLRHYWGYSSKAFLFASKTRSRVPLLTDRGEKLFQLGDLVRMLTCEVIFLPDICCQIVKFDISLVIRRVTAPFLPFRIDLGVVATLTDDQKPVTHTDCPAFLPGIVDV